MVNGEQLTHAFAGALVVWSCPSKFGLDSWATGSGFKKTHKISTTWLGLLKKDMPITLTRGLAQIALYILVNYSQSIDCEGQFFEAVRKVLWQTCLSKIYLCISYDFVELLYLAGNIRKCSCQNTLKSQWFSAFLLPKMDGSNLRYSTVPDHRFGGSRNHPFSRGETNPNRKTTINVWLNVWWKRSGHKLWQHFLILAATSMKQWFQRERF